jgi:hypothetical protein
MGGAFSFNGAGLKAFAKELGKLPAVIRKAEADTLNNIAFKFREESAAAITGEFTSRRPDFVLRQMRYQRATPANLESVAGSVGVANNPAFTGFIEPLGKPDTRKKAPTHKGGRGEQKKNIVARANRMIPGAEFPEVDDDIPYGLPVAAQLSMLHRQGKKRFKIKSAKFAPGLYGFTGGTTEQGEPEISMIQSFREPAQPRRFDWIAAALSKITEAWVEMTHNKNIVNEFAKMKKTFK